VQVRPLVYAGNFDVGSELIAVTVEFFELELQHLPTIRLKERPAWVPPDCNHVTVHNTICYASPKLAFVDRYDADRQVLYCLDAAAKVLLDIKRGNVLRDVDGEFAYYWKGDCLLIDAEVRDSLEPLRVVTLKLPGRELPLVCSTSDEALAKYSAFSPHETRLGAAVLLPAERTPPADTRFWPPRTLQQLMQWFAASAPETARAVRRALAGLHGRGANHTLIVVQAKPTWFAFRFSLPFDARKIPFRHAKDFVNAILTKDARIDLERYTPFRVDSRYLVERNLRDGERSLLGKRVLLAGCGAIGSHVAHALGRSGAGFGGGSLTLADPDIFTGGNIGRHRLGIEALIDRKVEALARDLRRSLAGIDVRPVFASVLDLPLKAFDLIVDATAEE
ncbi:MAG: ThiF family adenylyltransferase, partial [Steroidobacteraceae bacterium]